MIVGLVGWTLIQIVCVVETLVVVFVFAAKLGASDASTSHEDFGGEQVTDGQQKEEDEQF